MCADVLKESGKVLSLLFFDIGSCYIPGYPGTHCLPASSSPPKDDNRHHQVQLFRLTLASRFVCELAVLCVPVILGGLYIRIAPNVTQVRTTPPVPGQPGLQSEPLSQKASQPNLPGYVEQLL